MKKKYLYTVAVIGLCALGLYIYSPWKIAPKVLPSKASVTITGSADTEDFPLIVFSNDEEIFPNDKRVVLESSQENISLELFILNDTKINLDFGYNPMGKENGVCSQGEYNSISINGKKLPQNMIHRKFVSYNFQAQKDKQIMISVLWNNKPDESCVADYDFNAPIKENLTLQGLSGVERWGRWSDGKQSKFTFTNLPSDNLLLEFDVKPFLSENKTRQEVIITDKNQQELTRWIFEKGKPFPVTNLSIPSDLVMNGTLELNFYYIAPTSPEELGLSQDKRKLGLGFYGVKIKRADNL